MHVHTTERQQPYNCRTSQQQNVGAVNNNKHSSVKPYPAANPARKHNPSNKIVVTTATTPSHHHSNSGEFNSLEQHNNHNINEPLLNDVKNLTSPASSLSLAETTKPLSHNDLNTLTYSNIMEGNSLHHLQNNAIIKHELEELSNDIRQQLSAVTDMTHHLTHSGLDDSLVAATPWYACGGNLWNVATTFWDWLQYHVYPREEDWIIEAFLVI